MRPAEYSYPLANLVQAPERAYVPSWRQDVQALKETLYAQRLSVGNQTRVKVGRVVHGKLIPQSATLIESVNLCNKPKSLAKL